MWFGMRAQGDVGAVTAEGPGRPEAGWAPPGGCHTLLVPSPRSSGRALQRPAGFSCSTQEQRGGAAKRGSGGCSQDSRHTGGWVGNDRDPRASLPTPPGLLDAVGVFKLLEPELRTANLPDPSTQPLSTRPSSGCFPGQEVGMGQGL